METYILDPRIGYPVDYGGPVSQFRLYQGFVPFRGEMREVRDVHQTKNGVQVELYL